MGSKDDISKTTAQKSGAKPPRKSGPARRRTRMFALEPRVLFDGALVADIVAEAGKVADAGSAENQAAQAAQVDTSAKAAAVPGASEPVSVVPATVEVPGAAPVPGVVASAVDRDAGKPAVDASKPGADADKAQGLDRVSDASSDGHVRHEIVFVDTTVRDYQTLIAGIDNPNTRIVLLDPNKDGLQQIADVLKQSGQMDAVHIISHGAEGHLDIGSTVLSLETMQTYTEQLSEIKSHLTENADILIYGCDFGKGADGQQAADMLANLTGADVAASTNATGDAALGGDWNLELKTGSIETDIAIDASARAAYHDVLALHTLDFDTVSAWTSGTSKSYAVDGNNVTISVSPAAFGNPTLSASYTGGLSPAQNALQFTLGATGSNTISIDFSAQPGGSVANVGFALWDVDNTESAVFSATKSDGSIIAPTQVATSAFNSVTASSATSVTVSGNGSNSTATTSGGNTYVYFNTTDIKSIQFTYNGTANTTLVVLNDITFMGKNTAPPIVDLDASTTATVSAGDAFAAQAYSGSTGAIPWAANWVETDATAGGSATAGQVQVVDTPTAGTDYGLRMNNSGTPGQYTGAARAIDLSGYYTSTISYNYITSAGLSTSDAVVLEVSSNGGTNWTLLKTYSGSSASTTTYSSDTVSIAGYESASTMVRFRISGAAAYTGASSYFYVDNVQISGQPTSSSNAYTEGDNTGVLIAATANVSVTDSDSANMGSARVVVGNFVVGDTLTYSTAGTSVTGAYDSSTGVLTLNGVDSKANYQSVIASIRYLSTSDDPTALGTKTTRSIGVTVRDSGNNEGNTATSTIAITAVNDAPVESFPGAQSTIVGAPLTFSSVNGNAISVADPDAATVQVTLSVNSGSVTLSGTSGLTFSAGDGTADATMTFSGSQAQVNAALAGMTYLPSATGTATLTFITNDLGGTGTGGAKSDTETVSINVYSNNILDLDSTPSVSALPSSSTLALTVSNGAMTGSNGTVPAGWTEVDPGNIASVQSNRYTWRGNTNGNSTTLSQALTLPADTTNTSYSSTGSQLVQTTVATANAVSSIAFDFAWENNDNTNSAKFDVSYNGVVYATFTTGTNSTTGSWAYSNGASGSAGSVTAVADVRSTAMGSNTITLGTPVAASGSLVFTQRNGSAASTDRVGIDNVVANYTASTTTTTTTVDLTATGWTTMYIENGAPVSIADIDNSIFDATSASMVSANISLTNQQTGDRLLVNGSAAASGTLASGIAWTRTDTAVTLSGTFTKAQYAAAIQLVQFENTGDNPGSTARTVNVSVNDGTLTSNVAVATINVTPVNDAPTLTSGTTGSITEGVAAGTTVYTATATDPDGPTLTYSLSGTDAAAFNINASTGVVTIKAVPDYET